MKPVPTPEFAVCGAGIIGVTVALELHSRGASVMLLDSAMATAGASTAAAGMLAAEDPHNPAKLQQLSLLSLSLYDGFLNRLAELSGLAIPYQTTTTIQYLDNGAAVRLAEKSIDPRQLAAAALQAVRRCPIPLLENCGQLRLTEHASGVEIQLQSGSTISAGRVVHASGAWFAGNPRITPRKGQMLRVQIPKELQLREVHRNSNIYVVPRSHGPQAGTALIGATDEDAGFDVSVSQDDLDQLRSRAAAILPALGSADHAPQVEAWAGLRPATADLLPAIGRVPSTTRQWLAAGHYRNGILLAPATAAVLTDMLEDKHPACDLQSFDPARLG